MEIENEYLNAVPSLEPTAMFLDRHTPTGLFQGQNCETYWVVETAVGRRAITLSDLYMPKFAVFTLGDRRLDYGWHRGKPTLHLDHSINSVERDETGIVGIDDHDLSMHCQRPDGTTEWVVLGVYEPEQLTGLFFRGWRVLRQDRPDYVFAEREADYSYAAEPFEPMFTVECAEELNIVVNCRE